MYHTGLINELLGLVNMDSDLDGKVRGVEHQRVHV
jgi:hypothetical protein